MVGSRRNNIADMTISEQIEVIKAQICNDYCRQTVRLENGEIDEEYFYNEICGNCPMRRL